MVRGDIQGFRLSPQQQRAWSVLRRGGAYGGRCELQLDEGIDEGRLRDTLGRVVARHDVLRTTYSRLAGMKLPVQVVQEELAPGWEELDLSGLDAEDARQRLDAVWAQGRDAADLETGPVLRAVLARLAGGRRRLLLFLSALAVDSRALHNVIADLAAELEAKDSADLEAGLSHLQYSEFQNVLASGEEGAEARAFWQRQRLETIPSVKLPFARPLNEDGGDAEQRKFRPRSIARRVAPELTAALKAIASRTKVSPSALWLTTWQILLWRTGGGDQRVVAHLAQGRDFEAFRDAVGIFARWLPIVARLEPGQPFQTVLEDHARQLAEIEEAADGFLWNAGEEEVGWPAVGFMAEEAPPEIATSLRVERSEADFERCDLKLRCVLAGDGLSTELTFDPAIFFAADAERLLGSFHALLTSIAAAPERSIDELAILGSEERQALLELGQERREFTAWPGFHRFFEAQVQRGPERPAVVCEEESASYGELNLRANRLARELRRRGVGPEVPVALVLERSVDLVAALLAVQKAGGAHVCLSPTQPARRLAFILEDLGAPLVVGEEKHRESLSELSENLLVIDAEDPVIAGHDDSNLEFDSAPEQLAYVVFTSGSTGRPKGVMVENAQLLNYVQAALARLDFPDAASFATVSTFAADLGNTMIYPALCTGGCLHVVSEERAADSSALADYFARHGIDCLKIVPSHLKALCEVTETHRLIPRQRLVLGGESFDVQTAQKLAAAAPEATIFNHYGPSETTVGVTTFRLGEEELDPRFRSVPIGRPLMNVETYVLDARLEPLPPFVTGELCVGGANLSRGYLGHAAMTAERFIPHPSSSRPGRRLYRTGDQVFSLPKGQLVFSGRSDAQVKFHGFRVELEELRAVLNRHPKVRDSVVAVKSNAAGRDVLVAYYVARRKVDITELRELLTEVILEETLPNLFVHLKKLPLTLNGKVNHQALPGVEEAQRAEREYVAPRTPAEELMAQIWSDVLGIDPASSQRLGLRDNFFDLGGHSLLATQLISRVRKAFALEIPLGALFESADLGAFAAETESRLAASGRVETIEVAPRQGELPLSFAQGRLWVMDQLAPGDPAYVIHGPARLRGPLDLRALESSLQHSLARHESLRTSFASIDGRAVQVIAETCSLIIPVVDLSGLPAPRSESLGRELMAAEARRSFDLGQEPLLRVVLFRLADDEHLLSVAIHHIVADGWSLDILMGEIAATYNALSRRQPAPALPRLKVQYVDYAIWQRRWLAGENLDAQLSYWRRQLRGAPDRLELPTDRERPSQPGFAGGDLPFTLSSELSRDLRELGRAHRVTHFMTLLAAFKLLLARYSGQEDVVVGTDVANRNRIETEGLIGFFVNNLVLRTDLSDDPTFVELLERVRMTTLGAYANQDMPFERLVKELDGNREFGQTPLFQVLFVLQNRRQADVSLAGLEIEPVERPKATAKFDLAIFVEDSGPEAEEGQVTGRWNYRKDLFDEATIATMAKHWETLLASVCADPEARSSRFEMLSPSERRQKIVKKKERRSKKLGKLRGIRRQSVDLEQIDVVRTGSLDGTSMPLLIEPNLPEVDLAEWAASNRDFVEARLLEHGALLFRGFSCDSVTGFEAFARSVTRELYGDYGDLPREQDGEKIYHSTPYPKDKMILFHNESSHMSQWPMRQLFYCATAARSGGETPIVDCRRAFDGLDPSILERFEEKKIMYVRNFTDGLDVSWQHFFKTEDRAEVERKCKAWSMDFEWKENGLRTRQVCDAVVNHPQTDEKVFFNQLQLFHVACMDPESKAAMREVFGGEDLPRDLRYGDGSKVEDEVVEAVSENYRRLAVAFPWQDHDILMVDNMLVAHARNPFEGPRKIVVAMGDMMRRQELANQVRSLG